MTIDAASASKIVAIIPRLASDHDGEVVACARAVERILRSAGGDWHDLAATFTRGATVVVDRPQPERKGMTKTRKATKARAKTTSPGRPCWMRLSGDQRIAWLDILLDGGDLSSWEFSFIESIRGQVFSWPENPLSAKQRAIVDRLIAKCIDMGVHP